MQLNILSILLIFDVFINIQGQIIVNQYHGCACEQLENEIECQLNPECIYLNNQCRLLDCDQIDISLCMKYDQCAFTNNQCVDFKTCSSHDANTIEDCQRLNSKCYFDSLSDSCKHQNEQQINCAYLLLSQCYLGKEGLCAVKNGKCHEMTSCDDVKQSDYQCQAAYPACIPSQDSDQCLTNKKCSDNTSNECYYVKEQINSENVQLCQYENDQCVDFDPNQQSMETCALYSSFHYHWDNGKCVTCDREFNAIALSAIAILFLIII